MDAKEAYMEKAQAQVKEIRARIELLRAKAEKAKVDARAELQRQMEEVDKYRARAEERLQELEQLRTQVEAKVEEVRTATDETWQSTKEEAEKAVADLQMQVNLTEAKEEYTRQIQDQMMEIDARMRVLRERADKTRAEVRTEMDKRMQELEKYRTQAEDRLQELQKTGGEAWKDLRQGMDRAVNDLRDAVNKARSRFT